MLPEVLRKKLEEAGFSAAALGGVRLGPGVVGRSSYVAVAALVALIVVAWSLGNKPEYLLIVGVLAVVLFLVFFAGVLWFSHNHPDTALLEGAELVKWRQLEIAAKGVKTTPELAANTPAPIAIDSQRGGADG